MCEKCDNGGMLIHHEFALKNGVTLFNRLRLDLDNNQLDMQYGSIDKINDIADDEWTHGADISVCPFCGTRLPITMTVEGFIETFDKYDNPEISVSENTYMYILFDKLRNADEYTVENGTILKFLTLYYNTSVAGITKIHDEVTITFVDPGYENLHL